MHVKHARVEELHPAFFNFFMAKVSTNHKSKPRAKSISDAAAALDRALWTDRRSMRRILALAVSAAAFAPTTQSKHAAHTMRAAFHELSDVANDGSPVDFKQFEGKVCYAVNVASA